MSKRSTAVQLGYRPDIDGLRAVAVLSIVAYHYTMPGITGGFIGAALVLLFSLVLVVLLHHVVETSFRNGWVGKSLHIKWVSSYCWFAAFIIDKPDSKRMIVSDSQKE